MTLFHWVCLYLGVGFLIGLGYNGLHAGKPRCKHHMPHELASVIIGLTWLPFIGFWCIVVTLKPQLWKPRLPWIRK